MERSLGSSALYEQGWSLRTLELNRGELVLPGWRVIEPDLLQRDDGDLLWIINAPTCRTRSAGGRIQLTPVDWRLGQDEGKASIRTSAQSAHLDTVELRGAVARAFVEDSSQTMHVHPLGVSLGGPRDLASFLLEDQIVAAAKGGIGPSEQLALSIYRIARLRGGAFWDAVANHVARATLSRVEGMGDDGPEHNLWGAQETHVRLLADTLLLLVAHSETTGGEPFRLAGERIADLLEGFGVPLGGGVWYLHDSLERQQSRNSLILNTHLHAMVALLAAGRQVEDARRALVSVLARRCRRPGAYVHATGIAFSDAVAALTPDPGSDAVMRFAMRSRGREARYRVHHRYLRAPGGWIALGVRRRAGPLRYMLVNLNDLAMLHANLDDRTCRRTLRAGLRYVRLSGFLRAQRRRGDPTVSLMPGVLRATGSPRAAEREAKRLASSGRPAAIGWPGYVDHLWSRLAAGTP